MWVPLPVPKDFGLASIKEFHENEAFDVERTSEKLQNGLLLNSKGSKKRKKKKDFVEDDFEDVSFACLLISLLLELSNVPERPRNLLEPSRIFSKVLECSWMFSSVLPLVMVKSSLVRPIFP